MSDEFYYMGPSIFFKVFLFNASSVFIRGHPRPKSSEFVGATCRVARTEFGVKGDKALFLILGTFLSVFICTITFNF